MLTQPTPGVRLSFSGKVEKRTIKSGRHRSIPSPLRAPCCVMLREHKDVAFFQRKKTPSPHYPPNLHNNWLMRTAGHLERAL